MNNLTSELLSNHYSLDINETSRNSASLYYDNGTSTRIGGGFIQSMTITIRYKNISKQAFLNITTAYESNHSNTFLVNFDNITDKRVSTLTSDGQVYSFNKLSFTESATNPDLFSGTVDIVTSTLYNFTQYQELNNESSSYTVKTTVDNSFNNLIATPYHIEYSYMNNNLKSSLFKSTSLLKDKQGLRKTWRLSFFLEESNFNELLTFYRKKGATFGEFGFLNRSDDINYLVHFTSQEFSYTKAVNGMYSVDLDIEEIK